MADTESFTRFPKLPGELRIQIWTEALTVSSVWVAVLRQPSNVHGGGQQPTRLSISMTCVGPSPHLVGLSCKEARDIMERIYKRPLRGRIMETTARSVYWIYLDKAVITFVTLWTFLEILRRFGTEISRFQHVALVAQHWTGWSTICYQLADSCPALRTIIVQRVELPSVAGTSGLFELDAPTAPTAPTAAYYAALAQSKLPEIGGLDPHTSKLWDRILQYFAYSSPTVHILHPVEVFPR